MPLQCIPKIKRMFIFMVFAGNKYCGALHLFIHRFNSTTTNIGGALHLINPSQCHCNAFPKSNGCLFLWYLPETNIAVRCTYLSTDLILLLQILAVRCT